MNIDPLNLLSIISGLLFIFLVVIIQSVHLVNVRTNELDSHLVKLKKLLALRYDLVPLLIELLKDHSTRDAVIIGKVIEAREKAKHLTRTSKAEHDFLVELENLLIKAKEYRGKGVNARLIEIEQEINELNRVIARFVDEYNEKVDRYNRKRLNPLYFIINLIKAIPRREKIHFIAHK